MFGVGTRVKGYLWFCDWVLVLRCIGFRMVCVADVALGFGALGFGITV